MLRLAALLCVLLASAATLRAQSPAPEVAQSTLLIVRTGGDQEMVRRIEAELRASTWSIVQIGPDAELERAPLRDLAGAHGASAAMRIDSALAEIELWVAGVEPASEGHTELLSATGAGEHVLALRAVETLRARELALDGEQTIAPAPEKPEPAPVAADEAARDQTDSEQRQRPEVADEDPVEGEPPAPALPRVYPGLWLELAPAVAYSPGGLAPSLDGWLGVRVQPAARWSVAGFVLAPIWRERMQGAEGSARISTLVLGVGALAHVIRSPFDFQIGAGMSGVVAFTSGDARAPYTSSDDTVFAPAPFAASSLHVPIAGGFRACLRAIVGATLPRLTVRFGGREAAHWGTPFVAATLGLELALLGR